MKKSHINSSLQSLILNLSKYKNFGILGFGKEGKSFLDFLLNNNKKQYLEINKIIIFDKFLTQEKLNLYLKENRIFNYKNIILFSGESYKENFSQADIIIKAPGISCFHEKISDKDIKKYNITSLSDLFLNFFGHQTIGITGTKGKSTTASLLFHLFQKSEKYNKNSNNSVFIVGNIGKPVFEIVNDINENSIIIHEFSSHQLEKITVGPRIAVLLNLFPEHLDYYENKDKYFEAKYNIFKILEKNTETNMRNGRDYISIENKKFTVSNIINKRSKKYFINDFDNFKDFENKKNFNFLEKIQNISVHSDTVQVVKIISDIYNLFSENDFIKNINNFKSLPHRLELLNFVDNQKNKNILFINDSISTIPESTIEGIKSVQILEKMQNKKLDFLILGGFDRGVCLKSLVDFVENRDIKNIFLTAQTGKILKKLFKTSTTKNIIYKEKLEDIIFLVKKEASSNSVCLFSPSASSFDEYKNFEERGDVFKKIVKNI